MRNNGQLAVERIRQNNSGEEQEDEGEWLDNEALLNKYWISYSDTTDFESVDKYSDIPEWIQSVKDTMLSINACDLLLGIGRFDVNKSRVKGSEVTQMALVYYYKMKRSLSESVKELVEEGERGVNPLAHYFSEIEKVYESESKMGRKRRMKCLETIRDHQLLHAGDIGGVLQALAQLCTDVRGLKEDEITTRNLMVALETFLQEGLFDLPPDQHAAVSLIRDALKEVKLKEPVTTGEMKRLLLRYIRRLCEVMPAKFQLTARTADKKARSLFGMLHSPDNPDLGQRGGKEYTCSGCGGVGDLTAHHTDAVIKVGCNQIDKEKIQRELQGDWRGAYTGIRDNTSREAHTTSNRNSTGVERRNNTSRVAEKQNTTSVGVERRNKSSRGGGKTNQYW